MTPILELRGITKRFPGVLANDHILETACDVALHHHERWDGKGYPSGLKGSQIPPWARFTAVADTYHALVSDRPYRKGMAEEKALQIIRDERGMQFCPDAVEAFFQWYEQAHSEHIKNGSSG